MTTNGFGSPGTSSVQIDRDLHHTLRVTAANEATSITKLLEEAVRAWLDAKKVAVIRSPR